MENSSIISQGSSSGLMFYVGRIASGPGYASINECVSGKNVEVTGGLNAETGGIVGAVYFGEIRKCINYGMIYGSGRSIDVGGICGIGGIIDLGRNVINCYNEGQIIGADGLYVGGFYE